MKEQVRGVNAPWVHANSLPEHEAQSNMLKRAVIMLLVLLALPGCVLPGTVSAPTPYPPEYIPTVVYLTALSIDATTRTASPPTVIPTATNTFIPPTLAPTESPTPGPEVPLAAIQVKSPGPMSRIVTPLQVQVVAIAGESKRVQIDLFGEDGRLLGRSLVAVPGDSEGDLISVKIPFEIRAAGENGYVQVSTKNGRERVQSLITVPILLLSSGESQVNPPGNTIYERVAFANLPPEAEIAGGELEITGEILPFNNSPIIMELISDEGDNLSLRVLNAGGTDWQAVHTTLPFKVSAPTQARLYVHQADDLFHGDVYVYSQLVNLNP